MAGMMLSELLSVLDSRSVSRDVSIMGVAIDSRKVRPGFLYIAMKGHQADGHDYIDDAITAGARAILSENSVSAVNSDVVFETHASLRQCYGDITKQFYGNASDQLMMVGITGTNGKTSVAHYLQQALNLLVKPSASIGTLGLIFDGHVSENPNTTPDAVVIHEFLASVIEKGAQACAMEVSSHALAQQRVMGLHFKYSVFTNLTHDHLDYHGDMKSYFKAKSLLFSKSLTDVAVINTDDEYAAELNQKCMDEGISSFTFSVKTNNADLYASDIRFTSQGSDAVVHYDGVELDLTLKLFGRFNLSNALAVMSILLLEGYDLGEVIAVVQQLQAVPGRMQMVGNTLDVMAVVDYAHTPDALKNVLQSLNEYKDGQSNLMTVFGCGGDRDKAKRPLMAKVAEQYSDYVLLTSDNPRSEPAEQIAEDVCKGFTKESYEIDLDREAAIFHAVSRSTARDIILVAGKGHEDYQLVGDQSFPFSDSQVLARAFEEKTQLFSGGVS